MFRYRCPQCHQLLQAPEIRAGKTTVCSKCSQPLTIPADKTRWLNEKGEPLLTSPTVVIRSEPLTPPPVIRVREEPISLTSEPDNDVLGAIYSGEITPEGPASATWDSERLAALDPSGDITPTPPAVSIPTPAPQALPPVEPFPHQPSPAWVSPEPAQVSEPAVSAPPRYPTPLPRSLPHRTRPVEVEPESLSAVASVATPEPKPPIPTPPPRRSPFAPTPPNAGPRAEPAWAGASSRSDSRSRRFVASGPVHPAVGTAVLDEPLRLRSGMDLAVNLTSALTSRMKPPPKPPRDLKPSTALWILATGIGIALLMLNLFSTKDYTVAAVTVGGLEMLVGYAWITWLAYSRDWRRGLACAVPPITFWYLTRWKYAKYRPLRFVGTGAVLIGLAAMSTEIRAQTREWVGADERPILIAETTDITTQPKIAQIHFYQTQKSYSQLIDTLRALARTDPQYSDEAKNRVELTAELRRLCDHKDSGVKVEALAAYATWGGNDARELCLQASRQPNSEERLMALRLLSRWKDEGVARVLAEHIGRAGTETTTAQESLIDLGGPVAEQAVIPLLRHEDQGVRLTAIEILGDEKVGGLAAVRALQEVARKSSDPGTRLPATTKAEQIQARLNKK